MKKIIRTNNLQKALEDYDALKGQAVSYVSVLPLPPNVRNGVYCKQSTTNIEESMVLTVDRLIENYAQETETANHFVIPETYTITYSNDVVKGIEVSGDVAIMYEDEEFTTALATTFNLEDNYIFDVITHVTEMAYYMGDAVNQVLHPVVSFGVIAEVHAKIDRVERELDAKIDNSYNTLDAKIDNEISNLAVNFTTDNLVANVTTVNNAVVTNASVSSLNVAEIIANGSAGTNGQILGKVNGNLQWQDFSTDNFVVNNITVNNDATVNGNNFTHKSFDVTSMTVISEDDYNNLDWNFRNQAFYLTSPNGNMYFHGIQYAPSVPVKQGLSVEAYVDLPNMAENMKTITTSTLTFTSGAVTNSFVNNGSYNGGFFKSNPFNFGWDNSLSIGTQANTGNIITNANELYITNAYYMYYHCENLIDTFICNPSLITGAPADYDPMKYCNNMLFMFGFCKNLNKPITIPNSVTSVAHMLRGCSKFNQPITIPSNVTNMAYMFAQSGFNQPIIIPNGVTDLDGTFIFSSFNQPITIPSSVTNLFGTFQDCGLDSSTVPIHISHTIAKGNTSNYIYNCLVNGWCGIEFAPSRILNDA